MAEAVEIIEDDPIEVRRAKREALIAAGIDPYGHSVKRSHSVGELNEKYAHLEDGESTEDEVLIAGRVMAKRVQGKIAFLELRESGCDIQLFCRINALGEEAFAALCDLDVGDWIAVHGTMMRTRRGQLSVAVDSFELMSKSLRPLPEKFHGLTDKETRYRQRYVDLVMNPEVRTTFERRFKIVSAIRRYMEEQGYYEVETPFLHAIIGGANAKPFITHFNALDRDYYLRIATELPLKRLLVGGFEKVFEIGRQFRNEGMDPYHNPEFTTMEAYEAFGDLDSMMDLTEGCIKAAAEAACGTLKIEYQGTPVDLSGDWRRASMMELASEHAGEEVSFDRSREELAHVTVEQALKHPQWRMGDKITIDSATLVNKGFEVIEAHWLFGVPAERISVLIHPQSIVHSMVEFGDGAIKAQLGSPDMRTPIAYALSFPQRLDRPVAPFSFAEHPTLTFAEVDRIKYPALDLAYDCLRRGGTAGCTMNGANEVAVAAFLARRCGYLEIVRSIEYALGKSSFAAVPSLGDLGEANAEARCLAAEYLRL